MTRIDACALFRKHGVNFIIDEIPYGAYAVLSLNEYDFGSFWVINSKNKIVRPTISESDSRILLHMSKDIPESVIRELIRMSQGFDAEMRVSYKDAGSSVVLDETGKPVGMQKYADDYGVGMGLWAPELALPVADGEVL